MHQSFDDDPPAGPKGRLAGEDFAGLDEEPDSAAANEPEHRQRPRRRHHRSRPAARRNYSSWIWIVLVGLLALTLTCLALLRIDDPHLDGPSVPSPELGQ